MPKRKGDFSFPPSFRRKLDDVRRKKGDTRTDQEIVVAALELYEKLMKEKRKAKAAAKRRRKKRVRKK